MAAVLLAAGTLVSVVALPHSRVLLHQPLGGFRGQASDIEIHAKEILRVKSELNNVLAGHTGQPLEKIARDTDRDFIMTAQESVEYGVVDEILTSTRSAEDLGIGRKGLKPT